MKRLTALSLALLFAPAAPAELADQAPVIRKYAENKFSTIHVLPDCTSVAVESGDPTKGAAVFIVKSQAGCLIPWHWHTATEHVMIVSGSAKVEMKDSGPSAVIDAGGYALLPGKHPHQFTCLADCKFFIRTDGAFDIHYIDANGNEISPDQALGRRR